MGRAAAPPGLRPFLPADTPLLAELFRESVETLAAEDYDEDQRAAWAAAADDEAAFAQKLAGALTLVASLDGEIAGFASLRDNTRLDMLYVHPRAARRGVGAALTDALEKLAQARGAREISVDASDAARDFFAARGYVPYQRNTRELRGEWLGNTTMKKTLDEKAQAR
ncbi:GNAT family N-acetyltransferase [Methylosinus trichosporium]|uniref:GNAT family N-acetyltransferase n=1 Tax=Methylosinus trichosporium (strain ATCC 35070 / NCIMB 11131 / UNIQEM 75 / OB3b) TaxID=595536 RepID=A0A2D2D2R4_METT3|nr:GNAT family N-acetyltransferase [Methylosinus trichosporium]ATQ69290.1 GNAT family N-acetyltransferase [Methylosinus trichosporium OB3b]